MSREYVPLSTSFFEDDKVIELSPLAQLVFVGSLCVAKRIESDGQVSLAQIRRECPNVGDLEPLLDELTTHSLLTRSEDGTTFAIVAWLRWNSSVAEIKARREYFAEIGRKGGQRRRATKPEGPTDEESATLSASLSTTLKRDAKQLTRPDLTRPEENGPDQAGAPAVATNGTDPRFDRVVGLFSKRAADKNGVKNPASYAISVAGGLVKERGVEIQQLLKSRPSASVEQLVDILEKSPRAATS